MARYAMVKTSTGIVENLIGWDGKPETWTPPNGYIMVEDPQSKAGPGFKYENGQFTAPESIIQVKK